MTSAEFYTPKDIAGAENTSASETPNTKTSHPQRRILYRHPFDKRLAGVCGGMGDYFDIDPVLIRILWLLATLATGGLAILAYVMLWLVLPVGTAETGEQAEAITATCECKGGRVAWLLIGLGILWLLANTGLLPRVWDGFWAVMGVIFWPAVLILAGLAFLRNRRDETLPSDVRSRIPDGDAVREGLNRARRRLPLRRPREERMLLGVCSGLAHALDIDTAIVRILWALFSIGSLGTGVILYVILAILMPEEEPGVSVQAVEGEILDPMR